MKKDYRLRAAMLFPSFLCAGLQGSALNPPEKTEWTLSFDQPAKAAPILPAQEKVPSVTGLYLGIGGLYTFENFDLDKAFGIPLESSLGGDVDVENTWGYGATIGYRFSPYYALEVEYERYDEFNVKFNGGDVGDVEAWSAMASFKAYLAVDQSWQPYFMVGFGKIRGRFEDKSGFSLDASEDDIAGQAGLGFDVELNRAIAVNIEGKYVKPLDDLEDFSFGVVSLGLVFRF